MLGPTRGVRPIEVSAIKESAVHTMQCRLYLQFILWFIDTEAQKL